MCNMQVLHLYNNKIGDVGLQAFADALGKGALDKLIYLSLNSNKIGDVGLQALANALGNGALDKVTCINLDYNQATETGKRAMRDVAKVRGISVYLA